MNSVACNVRKRSQQNMDRRNEPPRGDLKVSEVARTLGVSDKHVRDFIERGKLSAYKYGPRGTRVRPEDLDAFREAHRIRPRDEGEAASQRAG